MAAPLVVVEVETGVVEGVEMAGVVRMEEVMFMLKGVEEEMGLTEVVEHP
jgi:hypothetical protein